MVTRRTWSFCCGAATGVSVTSGSCSVLMGMFVLVHAAANANINDAVTMTRGSTSDGGALAPVRGINLLVGAPNDDRTRHRSPASTLVLVRGVQARFSQLDSPS